MVTKKIIIPFSQCCALALLLSLIVACGATNPPTPSEGHIKSDSSDKSSIPAPVTRAPALPRPGKRKKQETYTVVVNEVPVRELLFAMARDADLNLDIDSDITGKITMNAIDQSLPSILDRIESQAAITYFIENQTLKVKADKPYIVTYNIDYLNINRSSGGSVSVSTEIGASSSAQAGGNSSGSGSSGSGNKAKSEVVNESTNEFWASLANNIAGILDEEMKQSSGNQLSTSNNIIVNRESGIIAVRATAKQHKTVKKFVERVVGNVQRQVLIEATIAEVNLSDIYKAGVDWSLVSETAVINNESVLTKGGIQDVIGGSLGTSPFFQLATNTTIGGNPLNVTLKALETFGDVKVLSSPKVMALNNQTAILKVVDNEVYFTLDVNIEPATNTQGPLATYESVVHTVPVGIVMSVTPFIDENNVVTMNVRPTISSINGYVNDPNPTITAGGVESQIPRIQVREIETMLKVNDRETAVIGGLMQDTIDKDNRGVPGLSSIPLLGALFSYTEEVYKKSELVIFLRPVVIEHASLDGDLADYKKYLLDNVQQETSDRLSFQ